MSANLTQAPRAGQRGTPTVLSGWGANHRATCFVELPETLEQARRRLDRGGSIARGLGRSYGDPATNDQRQVLAMTQLDRYLAFDPVEGILDCEAGVSLEQIIADFTPRGWFPMITPGTKYVTVGGCIANDIHGKAHHAQGTFSTCVEQMHILLADGEVVVASRESHPELYWASFGGLGLLGVVVSARIRLRRIESSYFSQQAIEVKNLEHLLEAFETHDALPYSVAWIDSLAKGARLGRGVLQVGDHARSVDLPSELAANPLKLSGPPIVTVPFTLPELTLNRWTIRALNVVLELVQTRKTEFKHYENFFYPLDAIGSWYRGYGKRGFTQYQFVIPLEDGPTKLRTLLETIASSDQLPFLNVLKRFGPEGPGHLSFPFEGYTFAIDFPIRDGLRSLLARLDAMVVEFGGRIYLGKDSFLDASRMPAMYPRLDAWRAIKDKYDPQNVFTSDLGRRVGLVPS